MTDIARLLSINPKMHAVFLVATDSKQVKVKYHISLKKKPWPQFLIMICLTKIKNEKYDLRWVQVHNPRTHLVGLIMSVISKTLFPGTDACICLK